MSLSNRFLFSALAVAGLMSLSACGVGVADLDGTSADLTANTAEQQLKPVNATLSATDTVYGGTTQIAFYPGSYASSAVLEVSALCSQNGQAVLSTGSLNYKAFSCDFLKTSGIICAGDHYDITMGPLRSLAYTSGAADCVASAMAYANSGHEKIIATTTFHIAP